MTRSEKSRKPIRKTGGRADTEQPAACVRKRYSTPRLTVYGRLDELTQFGGSVVVDSGSGLGNLP